MKTLSRILVDSYYELESSQHVPLMMEWTAQNITSIGVSKSDGSLLVVDQPSAIRSAIFPIEGVSEDIFSRVYEVLKECLPMFSMDEITNHIEKFEIAPKWIIGSFYKNSNFEQLFKENVGVLNHESVKDSILVIPGSVELGFFTVFSKKGSEKVYATYVIRNPLTQISMFKWKTS